MVARKRLTVAAVGLAVGLLAQHATGAEPSVVRNAVTKVELAVDAQRFRTEIEGYVRELDRQMRAALSEELRRDLARKIVLASDAPRTTT